MDWPVELEPLFLAGEDKPVSHKAVVRQTDRAVLGVVGPAYKPLQNSEAFSWFDPFLASGEAQLHTAGSLRGGSRIWVLAKLNRDPIVLGKGEEIEKFLLLSHSHDGSLAVRIGFTPVRVVCANTLSMAHRDEKSQLIRIKHSKSVLQNLDDVRATVNTINEAFEATAQQYRKLLHTGIQEKDVRAYVQVVMGYGETPLDELSKRAQAQIDTIVAHAFAGRGQAASAAEGTLWGAYNGVTEYLNHEAGRAQDTRLNSLWYGENARVSERALELALQMAA